MMLSWNRDEEGIITVYCTSNDGKIFEVADFWLKPMIEKLGISRKDALDFQQETAELLVWIFNRMNTISN